MNINVTKPFLPPLEEYNEYVKGIWKRNWLTNHGPLVNELELRLKEYLELDHLLYVSNGTLALQIAIRALNLKGEIITTPFSYVATTSSIVWEGCKPVFADIDPETFNIDPIRIPELINKNTCAILATHVYGNPCDIEAIEAIAQKHNLKVIYDAAHCFGTKYKGRSIFEYGDISATSFHATKLFHTIEGGAVITKSPELLARMAYLRNFGHKTPESFLDVGINAKNSEFHAAMGLCVLKYMDNILQSRKEQSTYYKQLLAELNIKMPKIEKYTEYNFSYFPILFESEEQLLKSIELLIVNKITPRRYFNPSLTTLPYVKSESKCLVAEQYSLRTLCLPLFHDLSQEEQVMICRLLLRAKKYS